MKKCEPRLLSSLPLSVSLSLSLSLSQVQRPSDEASAGPECRQPVGEAPAGPQPGGVRPREASATAAGRDTELITSSKHNTPGLDAAQLTKKLEFTSRHSLNITLEVRSDVKKRNNLTPNESADYHTSVGDTIVG